jgi:hypothetical protein
MQSAWELGEDKIVSYRSNTLKPIILKDYQKKKIYKRKMFRVTASINFYIINSITKSYILNIKIRPLVTE